MNITASEFLKVLKEGKTEKELNLKEDAKTFEELNAMPIRKNPATLRYLVKYMGHTIQSAKEHLNTDYSNGFTICNKCGSYYYLGEGFIKHLSNGCLHCEGEEKHNVYYHRGNNERNYKSPARYMSIMFDDKMHYCKDKLEIEKFKNEI